MPKLDLSFIEKKRSAQKQTFKIAEPIPKTEQKVLDNNILNSKESSSLHSSEVVIELADNQNMGWESGIKLSEQEFREENKRVSTVSSAK